VEDELVEEEQVEATADGAPKKKRTRRGPRGGRGRKKPTAAASEARTRHRMIPATVVPRSPESTCRRPISRSPRWPLKRLPTDRARRPDDEAPAVEVALAPTVNRSEALAPRVAWRQEAAEAGGRQ
jgi:hypothetical protein